VPPETVKLAAPVELPKQITFVPAMLALSAATGCVIVAFTCAVHPFASVTVNVYVPADKPVCDGVTDNGDVPPAPVITTEPFEPPLQETFT